MILMGKAKSDVDANLEILKTVPMFTDNLSPEALKVRDWRDC